MNANELADDLKSDIFKNGHSITSYHIAKLDEAATMLRQQQAEIEALKARLGKAERLLGVTIT